MTTRATWNDYFSTLTHYDQGVREINRGLKAKDLKPKSYGAIFTKFRELEEAGLVEVGEDPEVGRVFRLQPDARSRVRTDPDLGMLLLELS